MPGTAKSSSNQCNSSGRVAASIALVFINFFFSRALLEVHALTVGH